MSSLALFCTLLLLPEQPDDQGMRFGPVQRGSTTALLEVQVSEKGPGEAKASVWLRVTVEGPAELAVEPARLDDSASAWKPWRLSSWATDGEHAVSAQSIRLDQLKPGVIAIPDVKVRFRATAAEAWEEVEWKNILREMRQAPDIEPPPPPPPESSWKRYLPWLAAGAVAVIAAAWLLRRRLTAQPLPLPPDQWALRELERIERTMMPPAGEPDVFHTQVSNVVRRYLQERFGLRAPQQTTAEFLAFSAPKLAAPQQALLRDLFERCDLAKFARAAISAEDCRRAAGLARTFVQQTAAPEPSIQTSRSEIAP